MIKDITNNLEVIKDHIARQTEAVVIKTNNLDIEDIIKKVNDPSYLENDSFQLLENGIQIIVSDPNIYQLLKDSIAPNIKSLTIPLSMLPKLDELSRYENLQELHVAEYWPFSKSELDTIMKNPTLTRITTKSYEPIEVKEKRDKAGNYCS